MSAAYPQRVVTISLLTTGDGPQNAPETKYVTKARYTYVSPVTGLTYQNAPTCILQVDEATNCLFVLDFYTTKAGWIIENIQPLPDSPGLQTTPGALDLSILTTDPFVPGIKYTFSICYRNTITNEKYCEDPQEGNGPPR